MQYQADSGVANVTGGDRPPGDQVSRRRGWPRVSPERFRRDRSLRAVGSHLFVWGSVNLLTSVPMACRLLGAPWHPAAALGLIAVAVALGLLGTVLGRNRIDKLCGEADESLVDASCLWRPAIRVGIFLTILCRFHGIPGLIRPCWMIVIGLVYRQWGELSIAELRGLGSALVISGLGAGALLDPAALEGTAGSWFVFLLWVGSMSLLWFVLGFRINRLYLYRFG